MLSIFQHELVRNAFLAGTIVAIVTAVIGYFTVMRAQAFAGHALSHVGFVGSMGAILLGINSLLGMIGLTLLASLGMGLLGKRMRGRDIEVGILFSFLLGCGVLCMNFVASQQSSNTVSVLFGSILSISNENVLITFICSVIALLLLLCLYRPLLFASLDPMVAEARGVPVGALGIAFVLLLALVVSVAVQVVGVLLVFALLIAPAATAEKLADRPATTIWLAIVLGLVYTWGGIGLTFIVPWPAGFCISALAAIPYLVVSLLPQKRRAHRYQPEPHTCRETGTEPVGV